MGFKVGCRRGRLPLWRRGLAVVLAAGATTFVAALVVEDVDDPRVRLSGLLPVASVLDVEDSPKDAARAAIRFAPERATL